MPSAIAIRMPVRRSTGHLLPGAAAAAGGEAAAGVEAAAGGGVVAGGSVGDDGAAFAGSEAVDMVTL